MKKTIHLLLMTFLMVCFSMTAKSAIYYVSATTGIDINNGTSLLTPVKTIQKGINLATMPNDIVYVATGVYNETITLNHNGVTVSAQDGNLPIIDGGTTLPQYSWGSMITIVGNNNTFTGFEVKNSNSNGRTTGGYGIEVDGNYNNVVNCVIHDIYETGVLIAGDNNTLQTSTIYRAELRNMMTGFSVTSGWGNGISAARGSSSGLIHGITSNPTIINNTVYNNYGEGIDCFDATGCIIDGNVVYDNWTNDIYLSNATNSIIRNNVAYNSTNPAIPYRNKTKPSLLLLADEETTLASANNQVYNNMFDNGSVSLFGWTGIAGHGLTNVLFSNNTILDGAISTASSGNVNTTSSIINNIILGNSSMVSNVPTKTGLLFSNNNWLSTPPANASSSTDLIGDPLLSKNGTTTQGALTKLYFKLTANSGVRGKATTLSQYTIDAFGNTRPTGLWDIGAHQYVVVTALPAPLCRLVCTAP